MSPESYEALPIAYGTRQMTVGVRGILPEYGIMRSEQAGHGPVHLARGCRRAPARGVPGTEVARKLFSGIPPVGETVRIRGVSFEVVGVLDAKVTISNYFFPDNLSVFVPHSVIPVLFGQEYVDTIVFQAVNASVARDHRAPGAGGPGDPAPVRTAGRCGRCG